MPKLYSSSYIISILKTQGFEFKSSRGSHWKLVKGNKMGIVPHPKREIPRGSFLSILKQSRLRKEDFEK